MSNKVIWDVFRLGQRCYRPHCHRLAVAAYRNRGHYFCSWRCGRVWREEEINLHFTKALLKHRKEMPGVHYERPEEIRSCPAMTEARTICADRFLRDLNGVGVICGNAHVTYYRQGAWEKESARVPERVGPQ